MVFVLSVLEFYDVQQIRSIISIVVDSKKEKHIQIIRIINEVCLLLNGTQQNETKAEQNRIK